MKICLFFTKLAIPFLLAILACANLEAKFSDVKFLSSRVVYIYHDHDQ